MTSHAGNLAPLAREWQRVEDELHRLQRDELATMLRLIFFWGALTHSRARAVQLVLMNRELDNFEHEVLPDERARD